MGLRIRSGPGRVIASGEVSTFAGHPLRFDLEIEGLPVVCELVFLPCEEGGEVRVRSEPLANGRRLLLEGFDRADGRGSAVPVLLGELVDSLVFLHFRVFRWGRTVDRTVHYTFFEAPKEEVGWEPMHPSESDAPAWPAPTNEAARSER